MASSLFKKSILKTNALKVNYLSEVDFDLMFKPSFNEQKMRKEMQI